MNAKLSTTAYSLGIIILGIITTPIFGLGLLLLLYVPLHMWFIRQSNQLSISDKSVDFTSGFFSKDTTSISLRKIETVEVAQDIWGRVFGYGRLRLHGTGASNDFTPWIVDPKAFKSAIEARMEAIQNPATAA